MYSISLLQSRGSRQLLSAIPGTIFLEKSDTLTLLVSFNVQSLSLHFIKNGPCQASFSFILSLQHS